MVSTVGRQVIMPMVVGGHAAGQYLFKSYDGVSCTKLKRPACPGGLYAVAAHMESFQFMQLQYSQASHNGPFACWVAV